MAAATVVGPCLVKRLQADGNDVTATTGADTAAWRKMARREKSHVNDAVCTAMTGARVGQRCERTLSLTMTGRGRRLVVQRDRHGMPRRRKDGTRQVFHRAKPKHGFRAGDVVRIHDEAAGGTGASGWSQRHDTTADAT